MSEPVHIRIGNQSAFSASTVIEPFEYAVASGFDAFEWFPDKKESGQGWEANELDAQTRHYIRDTALEHDISLSVHVPWESNPLISEDHGFLSEEISLATDIRASLLNIHLHTEEGVDVYLQALSPLLRDLTRLGIKVSIENSPLTTPQDFNALFSHVRNLDPAVAAHVGVCLDMGHANLCSTTHNDYLRFVDLLDHQIPIIHIHVHENYGDYDSHMPLFTGAAGKDVSGVTGFIERIKRRRFSGSIILEQWPEPRSLLNDARDRLRAMIGNATGEAEESERVSQADVLF